MLHALNCFRIVIVDQIFCPLFLLLQSTHFRFTFSVRSGSRHILCRFLLSWPFPWMVYSIYQLSIRISIWISGWRLATYRSLSLRTKVFDGRILRPFLFLSCSLHNCADGLEKKQEVLKFLYVPYNFGSIAFMLQQHPIILVPPKAFTSLRCIFVLQQYYIPDLFWGKNNLLWQRLDRWTLLQ